ncbi:MAG TPA: cytochrome c [Bacteroidia bacterium]|nr:cytochrome c [Bacteroidia bacterium]
MNLKVKRSIFLGLCLFFIAYSAAVDTVGTVVDKGETELTADAEKGKLLFQKYNCTACHQLYGLGGYMGPDLTNVMSQPGKGAVYVNSFLEHGTTRMPDFSMSKEERNELIAFLNYTDHTGKSSAAGIKIQADGSITLPDEK